MARGEAIDSVKRATLTTPSEFSALSVGDIVASFLKDMAGVRAKGWSAEKLGEQGIE